MRYRKIIENKKRNASQTESKTETELKAETEAMNQNALEDANRGVESKDGVDSSVGETGKSIGAGDVSVNFGELLKGNSLDEDDKDNLKKALKGRG